MFAALCKVLITSRNVDKNPLNQQQKEMINNQTCDMVSSHLIATATLP